MIALPLKVTCDTLRLAYLSMMAGDIKIFSEETAKHYAEIFYQRNAIIILNSHRPTRRDSFVESGRRCELGITRYILWHGVCAIASRCSVETDE